MITSSIWLPATLVAGAIAAWRTAVQRRVGRELSVNAAGLVRYLYGIPVAVMLAAIYQWVLAPAPLPSTDGKFLLFCLAGGVAQIAGTNLLLMAFDRGNFVVGTAYSKTEAVQSALLSALFLGDQLTPLAWAGIVAGVAGVVLLALGGGQLGFRALWRGLGHEAARYGIASGLMLALTTIAIRRATFSLDTPDHVRAALLTLAVTVVLQSILQGGYIVWRERAQVALVLSSWRVSGQVGLLSSLGSACWFTGFASAPVALVRIVGQVEVGFTLAFARLYLGEPIRRHEVWGLMLVAFGVVLALAGSGIA